MITWQPEDFAGHAPYCVAPGGHSPSDWCKASEAEPQTLHGHPSKAWFRAHPGVAGYTEAMKLVGRWAAA